MVMRDAFGNAISGKKATAGKNIAGELEPERVSAGPSGTTVSGKFVTPMDKTEQGVRIAKLFKDLQGEGKGAVEKDIAMKTLKLKELNETLNFMENKWKEIEPGGGVLGRAKGLIRGISSTTTQSNPSVVAYKRFLEGIRPQISRQLGDVGNLSEQEQAAAMNLFPTDADNKETGLAQIKILRDYINYKAAQKAQGIKAKGKGADVTQPLILDKNDPLNLGI